MKKFIFSLVVMVAFSFGASQLMAQNTAGVETVIKTGVFQDEATVLNQIQVAFPQMVKDLKTASDPLDIKLKTLEVNLYQGMLNDLTEGQTVREAYEQHMYAFDRDCPNKYWAQKWAIAEAFNEIVFVN